MNKNLVHETLANHLRSLSLFLDEHDVILCCDTVVCNI